MKILFIGSFQKEYLSSKKMYSFCNDLGKKLAGLNVQLTLCSPFPDSVDYHLIEGIKTAKRIHSKIELHYPKDEAIEQHWNNLLTSKFEKAEFPIRRFRHFPVETAAKRDWKHSWLFCQIQALNYADIIIAIGGDTNGSSSLLLRIAEKGHKMILPIRQFGGSGDLFFERNKYELRDRLGAKYYAFLENSPKPNHILRLIKEHPIKLESVNHSNDPIFFISYPRARPEEADFIEMILRRRNLMVLRDEEKFKADEDIPNAIKENIFKSNIFIATWCKEYACSPWCFDELTLALERKKKNHLEIWLLCTDDTRIIHPDARRMLYHSVSSREDIKGKILNLVSKYKIID